MMPWSKTAFDARCPQVLDGEDAVSILDGSARRAGTDAARVVTVRDAHRHLELCETDAARDDDSSRGCRVPRMRSSKRLIRRAEARTVAAGRGARHFARHIRSRLSRTDARRARRGADQTPAGIRQAGRRIRRFHGVSVADRERQAARRRNGRDICDESNRNLACRAQYCSASGASRHPIGDAKDRWDVVRSLATLVHIDYRAPYFRKELLTSLKILQDGHVSARKISRLMGRRDGPAAIHAVEFLRICRGFFRRRQARHLEQRAGRPGLDGKLSEEGRLDARIAVGFEVIVPEGSTRCAAAALSLNGRRWASAGRRRRAAGRRRCHPVLSKRRGGTGVSRHAQFQCHQAL